MKSDLRVVNSKLPDPPYPEYTQAGSFPFDLETSRYKQSRTWLLADQDLRPWLLMVWTQAWDNRPCGSWDDDDSIISASIGCKIDWFRAHRKTLMSGWQLHSDGRFYHPVITEKVLHFLVVRSKWVERQKRYREQNVTSDSHVSNGVVTPESPPSYSSSTSTSATCSKKNIRRRSKKISDDWQPNQRNLDWLESHGLNVDDSRRLVVMFRDYWLEVGGKKASWDLAFRRNPVVKAEIVKLVKAGDRRSKYT